MGNVHSTDKVMYVYVNPENLYYHFSSGHSLEICTYFKTEINSVVVLDLDSTDNVMHFLFLDIIKEYSD